jgi:prevent-host-death family protein
MDPEVGAMESVGIAEIKRNISSLVNRVAFGRERILLTSRGKPKAALVSIEDLQRLEILDRTFSDVGEDLHKLREERDRELSGLH